MDVGAMEVPVAQAGPPNAQSAPCTPPKSSQKIQDNDEEESNEEPVEFDDEDVVSPSGKPRHWKLLGEWDTTASLDSEIKEEILRLATQQMTTSGLVEVPTVKMDSTSSCLGLWVQFSIFIKNNGATTVETYHCPLKQRCRCPCQIRVTTDSFTIKLECSGGEHTQERCHATSSFRRWEPVGYWECPEAHGPVYAKIDAEIDQLAHNWMRKSRLLAHPDHVPKAWDLGLWKLLNEYTKGEGKTLVRLYRCPAWDKAHCRAGIRILEGPGYVQMDICGSHNKTSHDKDGAPYLVKGKELILASENKDGVEVISVPSGKHFNYNSHHVLPLSLQA